MSAITSRLAPTSPVPWRLLAVAAAILLAVAIGFALVAGGVLKVKAPPFGLAANGPVFYSQNGELFTRASTAAPQPLLTGATNDTDPALSPDGTKLSFLRHLEGDNVELWSMNVDGSNLHKLAIPYTQLGWFDWSPQGDAAVLLSDYDVGAMTIFPVDGGPAARYDLGVTIEQPTFRPTTGSQLAFIGTTMSGERTMYLVNRDGSDLRQLALDPGFKDDAGYNDNAQYYFWTMSWSPTGDRVLYTQLEPAPDSPAGPGFRTHLASIDPNGTVVSDRIIEFDPATDDELGATWLPGADGLVFQSVEGTRHWMSIATLGASGTVGPARDLGVEANDWIDFRVSPDGTQMLAILPAVDGAAVRVAYFVDLASGTKTQVELGADAAWQRKAR
jgi:Tol biopolymer transport system component